MTARAKFRGHNIFFSQLDDAWRYSDTGERVDEAWAGRPCGHCGLSQTHEGHDGCLGTLPGVMNACCGHGDPREAYVQFWDKSRLGRQDALAWIKEALKRVEKDSRKDELQQQ